MDTTTLRTWESRVGALGWLDDRYGDSEFEDAEAVRVRSILNHNGWVVGEEWAVQLPDGRYVTGQEEG